ncbi:MAG: hypothetical protein JNL28_13070 [Planctomycetes bacterium]|nr:hypothetical protein [Planctomycetota bacterium]
MSPRNISNAALIVLFAAALLAPTFDLFVRADVERDTAPEFRAPTPKPTLKPDPEALYKYPARYESHFNDTFGLRDKILRLNSIQKYFGLKLAPTRSQVVGEHGWIYYAGDYSMEVVSGALPFTEAQLMAWQGELEARAAMHAAGGRRYLFALVPNKESIYPEHLPASIPRNGPTRMDQFVAWMSAHSDVNVLDMRPAFLAAKQHDTGPMDPLYTPHGTHWTSRGVYTAYNALVGRLAEGTSYAGPLPFEAFEIQRYEVGADSLASNLYLMGLLVQPGDSLVRREPNRIQLLEQTIRAPTWVRTRGLDPNLLPHTIVFHDSFGPFIAATLAQSFETLDMSEGLYDRQRIDGRNTRIVVEMFVERYLRNHVPSPTAVPEPPLAVDSGVFDALPHVLFDLAATPEKARPVDGLDLTRTADGGYRLQRTSAKDGLVCGPFPMPAQGEVRVQIEFESDATGSLDIMWRRAGDEGFKRNQRAMLPASSRRDTRDISIPALGGMCEIMLRPTGMQPPVVVRACRVRSGLAP